MLPAAKSKSGKNRQHGLTIQLENKSSQLQWEGGQKVEAISSKFSSAVALEKYNNAIEQDKKLAVDLCNVQLPEKKILRRVIILPSSTEENLQNVVSYEMDRYTPFSKDDVYFDVKVQERNRKDEKITVLLSVVKRTMLEEVLQFAAASGISIQSTFAEVGDDKQIEHFAFVKEQEHNKGQRAPSKINKYLMILALLLAIAALVLPIAKNYWFAEQYKIELQVMQEDVEQVRRLQSKYKQIKQDVDFIAQQSSHSIRVLDLLNELTKIIPNDTSLSRLVLEEGVVRVRGSSAAASKLISIIDSSENFVDVQFVAPVTQNSKTGKESFTIEFELHKRGQDVAISE